MAPSEKLVNKAFSNSGSINHHYIPQYYLKGFCRRDGTFDVYDKKIGKFKKAPQSPALVFFEPQRNNIKYNGRKTDVVEQVYSRFDGPLSELFELIRRGSTTRILDREGIRLLKVHMAIQFWRLPRLDWFAEHYLRSLTLEEVRHVCTISVPPLPAEKIYQLLQDDDGC